MSKCKNLRAGSKTLKRVLYERDKTCFKCGKHLKLEKLQLHHLKPVRNGGNTSEANCVLLCGSNGTNDCHSRYHKRYDAFLDKVKDYYTPEQYRNHLKTH